MCSELHKLCEDGPLRPYWYPVFCEAEVHQEQGWPGQPSVDTRNAGEDNNFCFFALGFVFFFNQPCQYWCSMAPKNLAFFV